MATYERLENIERNINIITDYVSDELLLIAMKKALNTTPDEIKTRYEKLVAITERHNLSRDFYFEYASYLAENKFFEEAISVAEKLKNYYKASDDASANQHKINQLDNFIAQVELDLLLATDTAATSYIEDSLRWIATESDARKIRERFKIITGLAEKHNLDREFFFCYVDFLVETKNTDEACDIALSLYSYYKNKDTDNAKKAFEIARKLA